jgi:hypothetical protein
MPIPPKPKGVFTADQYRRLSAPERQARELALEALSYMRHGRLSLSDAARAAGTTTENVLRFAGEAITRDPQRRHVATATDRLFRRMAIMTKDRVIFIDISDSNTASWIARYHNAVKRYLNHADDRGLGVFQGKGVRDAQGQIHPFVTDLDTLDALAQTGEIEFDSIYELSL